MDNKKLLIGAGVVVLGLLAFNYYNKKKSVSLPKEVEKAKEEIAGAEEIAMKPLSGNEIKKVLSSGATIEAIYKQ